jgi:hypothetical protein
MIIDQLRARILAALAAAAAAIGLIGEATTRAVARWEQILEAAVLIVAALITALTKPAAGQGKQPREPGGPGVE